MKLDRRYERRGIGAKGPPTGEIYEAERQREETSACVHAFQMEVTTAGISQHIEQQLLRSAVDGNDG